jgi:hypothetical protein
LSPEIDASITAVKEPMMNLQNTFSKVRFLLPSSYSEERWRRIRAKGKARFIFLRGVIGFGGLIIAVDGFPFSHRELMLTAHNVVHWSVALLFGYLFGVSAWYGLEKRFPNSDPASCKEVKIS